MKVLLKLRCTRIWASIRNVFSKWSSGILAVCLILLYGGLAIVMLFGEKNPIQLGNIMDMHTGILISVGFTALLTCMSLFQKRKALIIGEEAFYLFTGPFKRSDIMKYLVTNDILGGAMFAFLSIFMFIMMGAQLDYSFGFYVSVFVLNWLVSFFFLILTDYLYLLGMNEEKYKKLSRGIVIGFVLILVGIYVYSLIQCDYDFKDAFAYFMTSELFYIVPMFGWIKLSLIALVEGNMLLYILGYVLILIGIMAVVRMFVHYDENFVEQALEDAMYYSDLMKKAKAGKTNAQQINEKVKDVKGTFKPGALAIYSKGILMMKKTNGFLSKNELLVLVFYLIIAYLIDLGFGFYMYMIILWIFGLMQQSDLAQELRNYQVYLIPANPLHKLLALIIPTLVKLMILSTAATILGVFVFAAPIKEVIQYLLILYGYLFVFTSGSVLSIRILKSRNNAILENMLTMGIMIACSLPGIVLTIYLMANPERFSMGMLNVISYSSIVLNFVVSVIIVYCCKNMLNGRELKED